MPWAVADPPAALVKQHVPSGSAAAACASSTSMLRAASQALSALRTSPWLSAICAGCRLLFWLCLKSCAMLLVGPLVMLVVASTCRSPKIYHDRSRTFAAHRLRAMGSNAGPGSCSICCRRMLAICCLLYG